MNEKQRSKYFLIVNILLPASSFQRNGCSMFSSGYIWLFTIYTSVLSVSATVGEKAYWMLTLNTSLPTIRTTCFSRNSWRLWGHSASIRKVLKKWAMYLLWDFPKDFFKVKSRVIACLFKRIFIKTPGADLQEGI